MPINSSNTLLTGPYLELNNRGQRLRFDLSEDEHRLGRDRSWADLAVPNQGWEVISGQHVVLRREGEFYRVYDGNGCGKSSTNGLFMNHTRIKMQPGCLLADNAQLQIGQNPQNMILMNYVVRPNAQVTGNRPTSSRLNLRELQSARVELGREPQNQMAAMRLDAPSVSRLHASVSRTENGRYVLRDHSANGTYVNKQRLLAPYTLQDGDTVQIGPFTLLYRDSVLEVFDAGDRIRLDAVNLVRQVKYAGSEKTILNDVSLAIEPGQLVAIVGGSGAGKSTLMKTLLGIAPTTSGVVLLNGDDLRQNFDLYRAEIGYVPQDDIVHRDLTVEEVLSYACQLRLPPDTNIEETITKTLSLVKLSHVRHTVVHQLSGGQRKRVSIAVELLANPKLFFLDEPTSGLDPGLDKKMMELLRELADQGRTIVLVTHATSNLEVCDRVVFMGSGGQLCYFGPPSAAMPFFQAPSADFKYFADIYIKLDEGNSDQQRDQTVRQWADRFKRSPLYQQYVASALAGSQHSSATSRPQRQKASWARQWFILARRYLALVLRDRFSLLLLFFTAPIGVALLRLALNGDSPIAEPANPIPPEHAPMALRVLFVFTCATIWVGLSGTAQAIVKEAHIYLRERLVNLHLVPYLGSKFSIHAALAIIQSILLIIVIIIGFESPEPDLIPWSVGLLVTTFLTLIASTSLGLMISSVVKNPTQANSALPLLLLPQIIFSGILFDLEGVARVVSWLMISRWSIGGYAASLDVNSMVPAVIANMPPPPFAGSAAYNATMENLLLNWGVLCVHSLVCLSISLWQQKRKDVL
ncbi:MAG: ATP-binding cassette domain-containing protein [Phormidesmis sp.]